MNSFNEHNIALTGAPRDATYAAPRYYSEIRDGILYRFDQEDWDYCCVISLEKVTPGFSYAHACGDSLLPQMSVHPVYTRPIPVRDAPLRPSDAIEAACYRRAQALTRRTRVFKFSYGQQRLFIDGVPCQGPLTRSQARKKRVYSLNKIFERRRAQKEQLRLQRLEQLWGAGWSQYLVNLGYRKTVIPPYVPFPALPTSVKQVKKSVLKSSIDCSVKGSFIPIRVAVRDSGLADVLRQMIKSFRPSFVKVPVTTISLRDCIRRMYVPKVHVQMDSQGSHGVEDAVSSVKVSNTVITTHNEESVGKSEDTVLNWHSLTTTEPEQEYTFGTERWNIYKVIEWHKSDGWGKLLERISVPFDIMKHCWNQPSMAVFKNNRYWRSDIEFMFQLNTNKFQTGSLQCSYLYDCANDKSATFRLNVYGCSHTNNCLLDASGSNMGTLSIPYKWNNPYLNTDNDKEYCSVSVYVLNELDVPSTVYGGASVTIYYRFLNAKFMGTLDASLVVKPEMLTLMRALGAAAEAGLRSVNKDLNRDKPPEPSPPVPMTPRSTSSWCIGTNLVEPINLLRLDSCGQTPHPNINLSSMLVKDIVSIYGILVTNIEWNVSHEVGKLLIKIDAAPIAQLDSYTKFNMNYPIYPRVDAAYSLSPLAVVSSMFAYWRGTLNLRMDIVGTPFHKGQLLVSYIPRNHMLDETKNLITLELAKSSNYTICDLAETRSFTINVPYISSRPMYPMRYSQGEGKLIPPPGYLSIFVLNPLIPMDNVSKEVQLNFYIKAGSDFELMVPIQPSIGLPYDPTFKPEEQNLIKTSKSNSPVNKTGLLPFNYQPDVPILYVSNNFNNYIGNIIDTSYVMDFAIQVISQPWFKTEVFTIRLPSPIVTNLISDNAFTTFNYCALVERAPDIYVMVPIGKDFIKAYPVNKDPANPKSFTGIITKQEWCDYYKVSAKFREANKWIVNHLVPYADYVIKIKSKTVQDGWWLATSPQVDERVLDSNPITPMSGSLVSTSSGLTILGENFSDLKNMCRRYQKLFNLSVVLDNKRTDRMSVCFPVTPLGIVNNSSSLDDTIPELFNRCRDGVIPLIASGYRFWRGSIRYRIMTDNKIDLNIIVQHRPDIFSSGYSITPLLDDADRNSYLNHGYSMVIQNLNINNCVDIEVPWYNPNMLASCHPPSDTPILNSKYSLGSLFIGFNNNANIKNVSFSVYYCLGDDFRFSTFQGFPLMLSINHTAVAQPQMFSTIKDWIKLPSEIKKSNDMAEDFKTNILPKIKGTLTEELSDKFFNVYEILCDVASQIVHCVISPTQGTILWSIFNVFVKFGLLTLKAATKIVGIAGRLFTFTTQLVTHKLPIPEYIMRCRIIGDKFYYRNNFICSDHSEFSGETFVYNFARVDQKFLDLQNEFDTLNSNELKSERDYTRINLLNRILMDDRQLLLEERTAKDIHKITKFIGIMNNRTILRTYPNNSTYRVKDLRHGDKSDAPRAKPEAGETNNDPESLAASIISVIYSSICTLLNVKNNHETNFSKYTSILLKDMGATASGANNIFRFIQNNLKLFNKLYEDIMYNKYWKLRKYRVLETENIDLNKWANSVSILLQPRFRTFVDNKQLWRDAVFGAARYGFMYLTDNVKNPSRSPSIDPIIRKLYDQIVRLRDELQNQKLFPSLRQEAFSLWIHGPAGVGKSTLVDDLTTRMLKAINFTHINELKYTISPVTKHWDGCNQQPVIVIDDAFAVDEPEANASQLWAYFQICSPVPLRPPMAKLEDKSMTYNPEIFVTCSNESFPKVTMLRTKEALFRRRHLLIETRLNPVCTMGQDYPFGMTPAQVANYEHIQFRIAVNPRSPTTAYMAWVSFDDLVSYCVTKFKEFKIRSKLTYEARHELHYSLYPHDLDIPEEQTLRGLYTKDNEARTTEISKTIDSYGITLDESISTLEQIGEEIKKIPSNPDNPIHPSISKIAVDAAIKSFQEFSTPLSISEVLAISKSGESDENRVLPEMNECLTITQYMGINERNKSVVNKLTNTEKYKLIDECDLNLNKNQTTKSDPDYEILVGASEDFRSFELSIDAAAKSICTINFDDSEFFTMTDPKDMKNAAFVNDQLEGPPLVKHFYQTNCLHKLLTKDTPMIKTDNHQYLCWLVSYENHSFCVYDTPCRAENCVLLGHAKNTHDYVCFIRFVYSWYNLNYNFINRTYTIFKNECGINFKFIKNLTYNERLIIAQRNLVCSALSRYKELGLWQGYILPTAHWLGGWLKKIYQTLKGLMGVFSMIGVGFLTFNAVTLTGKAIANYRATGDYSSAAPEPQLISSGDSGTHNRSNNTRLIVSKRLAAKHQSNDHCLSSVIRKRINANTMYIEFTNNVELRQAVMKCLIVKGRSLLVIKHYYDYLSTYFNEDSECYLCWGDVGRIPFNYKAFEWEWFEDSNFGLIELPKSVSERKSIIPFIASEHQANTNVSPECEIVDINLEVMKIYNERVTYCGTVVIEPSHYSEELIMNGCWRYKRNYPGMCGSILLSSNLTNPIIGMHVAGGSGFGYSEPLTREMFTTVDNKMDGPIKEYRELDIPIVPLEDRKVYLTGSHRYAGNIDADLAPNEIKLAKVESGITKIKPSLLHGLYPILSEPGPLTPNDPRLTTRFSPLVEGCEKMCNPTFEFDACDISSSEEDLLQKLLTCVKPLRMDVKPLSLEQSLNGIPDLPGYEHINWDTSEGFPLSRIRPTTARNKRWLFNFNEQGKACGIHDALITIMEQKMEDRKNGIVPVTLHDDCLKDARIPIDKINVPGKTRIFSISPVDFTIQFRQYYLDFIAAYSASRFSAEHAIGINVHGLEWTDLAKLVGSDHMITGDYSGFGPTLNTEVLHAAFRIIFKWYQFNGCDEESHRIRYVMSREIANARHLMRDYVYQTSCGMPSGNPGTVIFNSLVNSLYIRCAYLKIMRRTLYSGLYCFNKYVTLVTYGDDLIAKLNPCIIGDFNFNTLSQFFFDLNLKFTDAAKTGMAVDPTIPLQKATFLKHCFNPHPFRNGVYLAGLDKASITECVNWVKAAPDMKDATYQNCNQATMLAYGWGPEYFNNLVSTIRKAWREKFNEYFQCRTWDELDSLFLDQNWDPNLKW